MKGWLEGFLTDSCRAMLLWPQVVQHDTSKEDRMCLLVAKWQDRSTYSIPAEHSCSQWWLHLLSLYLPQVSLVLSQSLWFVQRCSVIPAWAVRGVFGRSIWSLSLSQTASPKNFKISFYSWNSPMIFVFVFCAFLSNLAVINRTVIHHKIFRALFSVLRISPFT